MVHEGEGMFMYLCDDLYTTGPRHYIDGRFSGFQTNQLALDWNYFSNYPRPDVTISVNLECEIY